MKLKCCVLNLPFFYSKRYCVYSGRFHTLFTILYKEMHLETISGYVHTSIELLLMLQLRPPKK